MSWRNDDGNSMIEFLVAGLGLQLMLLALVTSVAKQVDSHSSAELLARQQLRSMQLDIDLKTSDLALSQLLETLGLGPTDWSVTATSCSSSTLVTAVVRGVAASAQGTCSG